MSLPTNYQKYIHASRYARYLPEEQRRETWEETVNRYVNYFTERADLDTKVSGEIRDTILNLDVMPSMRALATAGKALDRDNMAGFNCSALAIDRQRAFDELFYVLMCGAGVGFSVERQFTNKLPEIAEEMYDTETIIVVQDSKIGWASSFRELISLLYSGKVPKWNLQKVRPAGTPLKTFGGRASGPEPLNELFEYSVEAFRKAKGRKLSSLECHGLVCKIAEVVIVGGVRRSALISLSNLSDQRIAHAKSGQWWVDHAEYALANNSVCYTEKPDSESFMREWLTLIESKSGERGIFNRVAAQEHADNSGRRDPTHDFLTNPCGEISLRDRQLCNLSEVVIRVEDDLDVLKYKVHIAAIIGTLQATLTNFRYVSKKWMDNTEEESLLGVSLTGIMDHPVLSGSTGSSSELKRWLIELKEVAIATNKEWSEKLGINQATAITTTKPSGTVSQLVDSSSGIHPRYSPYYIRTVRADKKDPLAIAMSAQGFPVEDDVMKPDATSVFSFPIKAPSTAVFRDDKTAIEQLEHWLIYKTHWAEHSVSVTVYVKDDEWLEVGAWVYKHFNLLTGVSFLPHSDHTYKQAPYQEITEEQYLMFKENMPTELNLDFNESEDNTEAAQTLACTGGACEI